MTIHEFGDPSKPVILLLPGMMCYWKGNFGGVIDELSKDFYVAAASYTGFDESDIAMGSLGSDAAIEAADVVLMTDEPSKLVDAIDVAKATKQIVMQNIVIALGIKSVFLILGALGIAGMWETVFGDVGVTIIAVLNAMRILKK